jgi:ferredoxin
MSDITLEVDPGLCMSAQRCTYLAPQAMGLDDDGIARVDDPNALTHDQAERIAAECPNSAISVHRKQDHH